MRKTSTSWARLRRRGPFRWAEAIRSKRTSSTSIRRALTTISTRPSSTRTATPIFRPSRRRRSTRWRQTAPCSTTRRTGSRKTAAGAIPTSTTSPITTVTAPIPITASWRARKPKRDCTISCITFPIFRRATISCRSACRILGDPVRATCSSTANRWVRSIPLRGRTP